MPETKPNPERSQRHPNLLGEQMLQATVGKIDLPGQFLDRVIAVDGTPYHRHDMLNPRIDTGAARLRAQCVFCSNVEFVEAQLVACLMQCIEIPRSGDQQTFGFGSKRA